MAISPPPRLKPAKLPRKEEHRSDRRDGRQDGGDGQEAEGQPLGEEAEVDDDGLLVGDALDGIGEEDLRQQPARPGDGGEHGESVRVVGQLAEEEGEDGGGGGKAHREPPAGALGDVDDEVPAEVLLLVGEAIVFGPLREWPVELQEPAEEADGHR
ncbi:MAG: hypothetical protein HYU66_13540 [Armatimonadetes bacterium]|nr:hypothetical protein [Armatimonadota bacterium]